MDAEVDNYISRHHMEDYLCRSPFRTDIPDVLMLMDVYCLPSLWESLSIGLLEAMATGRVIVATPTDGTQEVITNGQNGLIIPYNSPAKASEAFVRLLTDEELRHRCQHNAARLIENSYNAQHTADAVLDIYTALT
jgi:glycosyltransferase involved in cell wall biosynthesis